jgi:hypothetical protein
MRTAALPFAGAALAVLLVSSGVSITAAPLPQQTRSTPATGAPSGSAQAPGPTTPSSQYIEETSFKLRRADIDAKLKTLPATAAAADASKTKKSTFGGLTDSLKKSVTGDDRREDAAKLVVQDLAQQASANNTKTVVVIIGSEDDRAKVKASMGNVQRHVVLALLDRSVKDDTYDNAAIGSGLQNQLTGSASNVLVFIPRSGQKAHTADQTLSTRVVSDKIWTAIFATDGDLPVEANNVINRSASGAPATDTTGTSGSAPAATPAAAATPASSAGATFSVGDVVRPKIASVKVMAQPSDSAKALATLAKTDELVVIGGDKDGFTNVQGAAGAGWVKTVMLAKP